jgi:hypothetical protein
MGKKMNKKFVLLIAILVVSVWGLSGCNKSSQTTGDTSKIELVDYNVNG